MAERSLISAVFEAAAASRTYPLRPREATLLRAANLLWQTLLNGVRAALHQCYFSRASANTDSRLKPPTSKMEPDNPATAAAMEKQPVTKTESLRASIKKRLRRSFRMERKSSTTSQKSV